MLSAPPGRTRDAFYLHTIPYFAAACNACRKKETALPQERNSLFPCLGCKSVIYCKMFITAVFSGENAGETAGLSHVFRTAGRLCGKILIGVTAAFACDPVYLNPDVEEGNRWKSMYANCADMCMIPRRVIRKTESLPVRNLMSSRKTGSARFAAQRKRTLKKCPMKGTTWSLLPD